jgi:hypothetical protein
MVGVGGSVAAGVGGVVVSVGGGVGEARATGGGASGGTDVGLGALEGRLQASEAIMKAAKTRLGCAARWAVMGPPGAMG